MCAPTYDPNDIWAEKIVELGFALAQAEEMARASANNLEFLHRRIERIREKQIIAFVNYIPPE